MANCHFCKAEIPPLTTIGHATVCASCGGSLKICFNCRFYDPSAYHQCREGVEEPVTYKDVANFCDHFVLKEGSVTNTTEKQAEARSNFLSLFNDEV
ncbi:MAG: hypothetical protein GX842_03795 [Spirochaetales bacterium]|nr:hypothetical protein [Spirochaetales bacterium]